MKYISYIFLIITSFCIIGCETDTVVTAQNTQTNNILKKAQRIQTLQFELSQHPEYKETLPASITMEYSADEIDQAMRNLKWKK